MRPFTFQIPSDLPESDRFFAQLEKLSLKLDFDQQVVRASAITPKLLPPKSHNLAFLRGYWTDYSTYCLIAWPVLSCTATEQRLEALRQALTLSHWHLTMKMHSSDKHYQSRLQVSFRAFRNIAQGDPSFAEHLPEQFSSLSVYGSSVHELLNTYPDNESLQAVSLCLDGALVGGGGYTRDSSRVSAGVVLAVKSRRIDHEEIAGRTYALQQEPNNDQTATRLRLANEESVSGPTLFKEDRDVDVDHGDSLYQAIRRAKGRAASIIRLSQLLAFDWQCLSLFDLHSWFNELPAACRAACRGAHIQASELEAFIALMFWCGRPADAIVELRAVRDYAQLPKSDVREHGYLVIDRSCVAMPRYQPDGAKEVSSQWKAYVNPSSDRVFLPLPGAAASQLVDWVSERRPTGDRGIRLFQHPATAYQDVIKEALERIRAKTKARITAIRLIRQMPLTIANKCGDRTVATASIAMPVGNQTTAGSYYYSATQTELATIYWRTVAPLGQYLQATNPKPTFELPPTAAYTFVGSNVCPQKGDVRGRENGFYRRHIDDLLNALRHCLSRRHKPEFLVAYHNAFTAYCVGMLGAATGYRAVKNPLGDVRALDSSTGLLLISDKDFNDRRSSRLVWLPDIVRAQIVAYSEYRSLLIRLLALDDTNLGFFFSLKPSRKAKPLSLTALSEEIEWSNKLPLNANRHYLRTYLVENNVPGEMIDAFMGHWDLGEEPYGPFSALSPADFTNSLQPILDQLIHEQGWRLQQYSLQSFASLTVPARSSLPGKKPSGASCREQDRERLSSILARDLPELVSGDKNDAVGGKPIIVDDERIDTVVDSLRQNNAFHDWRYAHNQLAKRLEHGRLTLQWQVKIPAPIVVLNRPPAAFTPERFASLAEFRRMERSFITSLEKLDPLTEDQSPTNACYRAHLRRDETWGVAELLVGQIVFSAMRFGGLLSRRHLKILIAQLPNGGMIVSDLLVFELEERGLLRRWYADALTCALILRLRHLIENSQIKWPDRTLDEVIRIFSRSLTGGRNSLEKTTKLLQAASTAWRISQPAFLYRWAENRAGSCSWNTETELRVRLDRRLSPDRSLTEMPKKSDAILAEPASLRAWTDIQHGKRGDVDLNRSYREFYDSLTVKRGRSWRGQIKEQIDAWIAANQSTVGLVPILFAKWIAAVAIQNSKAHQAIGAASSLQTYVSRLGRAIFTASSDFSDDAFEDEAQWIQLYQSIVDSKRGNGPTQAAATECQHFHNYVIEQIDVLPLSVGEAVGIGATGVHVSVNAGYITPCEMERAISWLSHYSDDNRHYDIARHALSLAYWSGLRISELCGIRLRDVQVTWNSQGQTERVELLVQSHHDRGLKSHHSLRRLPLSAIMPGDELLNFVIFYRKQKDSRVDLAQGTSYLFSASGESGSMPEHEEIRCLVVYVLRHITGDSHLVFHHLRHSAANNWLLALLARSSDDPVWNLFHERPDRLVELSTQINAGLLINANRRRPILHAVTRLMGHLEPGTTIHSYLHILPWLSDAYAEPNRAHFASTLEGGVALYSRLLLKTDSGTRSWRSRTKHADHIKTVSAYWIAKFKTRLTPDAYNTTMIALSLDTASIPRPLRPLPAFQTIYRIALLAYQMRVKSHAGGKAMRSRIAQQSGEPLWLVTNLLHYMQRWGHKTAERTVITSRKHHRHRYERPRRKHLRGHGDVVYHQISQRPELGNLMPALPRTKKDLEACNLIWKGLSALLQATDQWAAVTETRPAIDSPDTRRMLSDGLRFFLERSNSTAHVLKFFKNRKPSEINKLLLLLRQIYPQNRILVSIRQAPGLSVAKSLAAARKDLALHSINIRVYQKSTRNYAAWPYGIPSVKLLEKPYDRDSKKAPYASFGAWFGLYTFSLLYAATCKAEKDIAQSWKHKRLTRPETRDPELTGDRMES